MTLVKPLRIRRQNLQALTLPPGGRPVNSLRRNNAFGRIQDPAEHPPSARSIDRHDALSA